MLDMFGNVAAMKAAHDEDNHGLDYVERDDDGKEWRYSRLFLCGDYAGDVVGAANIRYVEQHYEGAAWWRHEQESWHTEYIVFDLPNVPQEFLEQLDALADYPVFDDELVSEIEWEWLDEAIDNWAMEDTSKLLGMEEYDEEQMREAIRNAIGDNFEQWNHTEYNSMRVDVDNPDYLKAVKEAYDE